MTSRLDALKARVDDTELGASMTLGRIKIERLVAVLDILPRLRREHLDVEGDCWYSCPKSGKNCDDSREKAECDCGADTHNVLIENALAYWLKPEEQIRADYERDYQHVLKQAQEAEAELATLRAELDATTAELERLRTVLKQIYVQHPDTTLAMMMAVGISEP